MVMMLRRDQRRGAVVSSLSSSSPHREIQTIKWEAVLCYCCCTCSDGRVDNLLSVGGRLRTSFGEVLNIIDEAEQRHRVSLLRSSADVHHRYTAVRNSVKIFIWTSWRTFLFLPFPLSPTIIEMRMRVRENCTIDPFSIDLILLQWKIDVIILQHTDDPTRSNYRCHPVRIFIIITFSSIAVDDEELIEKIEVKWRLSVCLPVRPTVFIVKQQNFFVESSLNDEEEISLPELFSRFSAEDFSAERSRERRAGAEDDRRHRSTMWEDFQWYDEHVPFA